MKLLYMKVCCRRAIIAIAILSFLSPAIRAEEASYVLATASTGGTYYPVGVALATLVKIKLQPKYKIGLSAISSAGSGENVRLLRENEAQFGILQGLYGYYAATGTGPFEKPGSQESLRSVTMLWQNVEQFVISADRVQTGTVSDLVALKGQSMALGRQNSGTIGSNRALLSGLGIDIDADYKLVFAGYSPSAEALQNGQVSGVGIPAGVPTGALTRLFASAGKDVTLLGFTPEQALAADGGRNLWKPYVIEAGTYPGQDADVTALSQPNFLAVSGDLPAENVYLITKAIYENLPFLQAIHPATRVMALEHAISGLPLPLHPGAARYYSEMGIEIPDRLIAE